jgi:redox-sensitive bicupin YhaK (pirin superfamily)
MIAIRRAEERGRVGRGPATSYLTFSCEQFKDPEHTGFRALRAINEDVVTPEGGVSHAAGESMDMLSCLLEGELDMVDENGRRERLERGSIVRTNSASSSFKPTGRALSRVLQVWIKPSAQQDTRVYKSVLKHGDRLEHAVPLDRHVWVQVLRGVVEVNGHLLTESDGAAVSREEYLGLFARQDAEVMVFELA